jgi:manganese peroxidase
MAFASLFASVALAAVAGAVPTAKRATCPDGTSVSNAACCAFIPLAQDLQQTIFQNECGEDGKPSYGLTYGTIEINNIYQLTRSSV